jgi:hypothetical protein
VTRTHESDPPSRKGFIAKRLSRDLGVNASALCIDSKKNANFLSSFASIQTNQNKVTKRARMRSSPAALGKSSDQHWERRSAKHSHSETSGVLHSELSLTLYCRRETRRRARRAAGQATERRRREVALSDSFGQQANQAQRRSETAGILIDDDEQSHSATHWPRAESSAAVLGNSSDQH